MPACCANTRGSQGSCCVPGPTSPRHQARPKPARKSERASPKPDSKTRVSTNNPKPKDSMSLDVALFEYPKDLELKSGFKCGLRPLENTDELAFHEFFLAVPTQERMFIKHRVTDPEIIRDWCQHIDLGRNLPLLAVLDG